MASVRECAKSYARTLILGAAAFAFSGCEITRQFDRDVPRTDSDHVNHDDSYASLGAGSIVDIPVPPGPSYRPMRANTSEVLGEVVDLDNLLAQAIDEKVRQFEAQHLLNKEADDPMNMRNPANWLRSKTPKAPPAYLNEDQVLPIKPYDGRGRF